MADLPSNIQHQPKAMLWAMETTRTATKSKLAQADKQITVKKIVKDELVEDLVAASTLMPSTGEVTHPEGKSRNGISIKRAGYAMAGAYPFLFDVIGYVMTHPKYTKAFLDEGRKDSITVKIVMPWAVFLDLALDDAPIAIREFLEKELDDIWNTNPYMTIWLNDHCVFQGAPLIINRMVSHGKPMPNVKDPKKQRRCIDPTSRVEINVLKELVSFASGYVQRPKASYAKLIEAEAMMYTQTRQTELRKTKRQQSRSMVTLKEALAARSMRSYHYRGSGTNRLQCYIYLHDNGTAESIHYEFTDFMPYFAPEFVRTDRGGIRIRPKEKALAVIKVTMETIVCAGRQASYGRNIIGYKLGANLSDGLTVYFNRTNDGQEYAKPTITPTASIITN